MRRKSSNFRSRRQVGREVLSFPGSDLMAGARALDMKTVREQIERLRREVLAESKKEPQSADLAHLLNRTLRVLGEKPRDKDFSTTLPFGDEGLLWPWPSDAKEEKPGIEPSDRARWAIRQVFSMVESQARAVLLSPDLYEDLITPKLASFSEDERKLIKSAMRLFQISSLLVTQELAKREEEIKRGKR